MTTPTQRRAGKTPAEAATIDPRKVPKEEYTTACRVLASSIRLALADPAKRADFEDWKRRRQRCEAGG